MIISILSYNMATCLQCHCIPFIYITAQNDKLYIKIENIKNFKSHNLELVP